MSAEDALRGNGFSMRAKLQLIPSDRILRLYEIGGTSYDVFLTTAGDVLIATGDIRTN